jgi:hypothetical protein
MARNKRNESALRPGPVIATLAVCALFVTLGVGYVWYKNQIDLLGHQIKERETHLTDLERQNKMRRDQLAVLCSPVALDSMVKKLNLGLGPPDKSQIIWIVEVPETDQTVPPPAVNEPRTQVAMAERKN